MSSNIGSRSFSFMYNPLIYSSLRLSLALKLLISVEPFIGMALPKRLLLNSAISLRTCLSSTESPVTLAPYSLFNRPRRRSNTALWYCFADEFALYRLVNS